MVGVLLVNLPIQMNKQPVLFRDLGVMDYQQAWDYQESLLKENVRRKSLVYNLDAATPGKDDELGIEAIGDSQVSTQHYLLQSLPFCPIPFQVM